MRCTPTTCSSNVQRERDVNMHKFMHSSDEGPTLRRAGREPMLRLPSSPSGVAARK